MQADTSNSLELSIDDSRLMDEDNRDISLTSVRGKK